jgi:aryl-alcohol dehydrogenase-like predicted oxidoreductase
MANDGRVNGIPTRILGSTGVRVTILCVGGYHIGKNHDTKLGVQIIRKAIDEGINFLDNAWCYNDGDSERIMGQALRGGYRDKVFLMTKNHGRDGGTYTKQLEESLNRLQTDMIDLVQFHEIVNEGDPEKILTQGPIEAALRAKDAGKIRFIGFTGHRWTYLFRQMLDHDFQWDTVQHPTNLLDAHYRSFTQEILPILKERGIGAIGMKSLAGGPLLETGISAKDAIHYSLSLPIDTLVSGMDSVEVLNKNLEIVRNWSPLSDEDKVQLLQSAAPFAVDGHLERYKRD